MEPLTPLECDLQDFPFMPLHVARLRDSDLAAEETPEACWYAVLLWAASWHQLPAASLPHNDSVLARLCGLGRDVRTFRKHKEGALRGFTICSDGRLYHPVVAEQAMEAWKSKLQQRWRTECARIKKSNQRNGTSDPLPTFEEWSLASVPSRVPGDEPETGSQCPPGNRLQETETGTGIVIPFSNENGGADPGKTLFDVGVAALTGQGIGEPNARSFLAQCQRDHGDAAALDALNRSIGATDIRSRMKSILGKAKARAEYLGV